MKILFFGRLSDEVGCREWLYKPAAPEFGFKDLMSALQLELGDKAMLAVSAQDITVAVDQTVVADTDSLSLASGSEVAFFPPVTGG